MMHGERHQTDSSTPPREGECYSRLPVKTSLRQDRLDPGPRRIPGDQQCLRATGSGPLRYTLFDSASKFFQLESGPRGHGNRRLYPRMDCASSIFSSPVVPHLQGNNEGQDGRGHDCPNNPLWQSQPWFPVLLTMIVDVPIPLRETLDLISPSLNCDCPVRQCQPHLVTWKVSGKASD